MGGRALRPWNWLHRACVGTAWTGFVVCLIVLGNLPSGALEVALRWTVGFLVVVAATILAVDVARREPGHMARRGQADPSRPVAGQ
jgi:hypothetical protein